MAFVNRRSRLDLSDRLPSEAQTAIRQLLESEPNGGRKVYAALLHKIWTLLIEQRLDDEIRGWHTLVQNVRAALTSSDPTSAERMTVLADLLRESVHFGEASPVRQLIERPHHKKILGLLARSQDHVARRELQDALGVKTAHLSNILSDLLGQHLIERKELGKEAAFRLTRRGQELLGVPPQHDIVARAISAIRSLEPRTERWDAPEPSKIFDIVMVKSPPVAMGQAPEERATGPGGMSTVVEADAVLTSGSVLDLAKLRTIMRPSPMTGRGGYRPHPVEDDQLSLAN